MKGFCLSIFIAFAFLFSLFSCQDESYESVFLTEIEGTWEILTPNGMEGIVIFTNEETFIITSDRGNIKGDINLSLEENTLSISYAEYENGEEFLTEEEYEEGYFCKLTPIDGKSLYADNFPLFKNERIILQLKE